MYKVLKPIIGPVISYYTISGDFILKLPKTMDEIDVTLTLIYKFNKRIKIILDKSTWEAVDWIYTIFIIIVN